ncbi:MAG: DUF6488 family protein [Desulfobacterales bacterium]
MIRYYTKHIQYNSIRMSLFLLLILLFTAAVVFAHGGKEHEMGEFTHLAALKKATELYDKLIDSRKLDPAWETDLEKVEVSHRQKGNDTEVVVAFYRDEGDPKTVFIFFTAVGEYAGSNFTGE